MCEQTEKSRILKRYIKNFIKDKYISQRDIAARLGVSPVTISYWCSGRSYPNDENLRELAAILDVDPDVLSGKEQPPIPETYEEFKSICDFLGLTFQDIITLRDLLNSQGRLQNAAN